MTASTSQAALAGLPLPMMDSFGDCFGPQDQPYARLELQGLELDVVSDVAP